MAIADAPLASEQCRIAGRVLAAIQLPETGVDLHISTGKRRTSLREFNSFSPAASKRINMPIGGTPVNVLSAGFIFQVPMNGSAATSIAGRQHRIANWIGSLIIKQHTPS
jgi:hypothetical protein